MKPNLSVLKRAEPYLVALTTIAAAILIRFALNPSIETSQAWLTFWPAILLAAWLGGVRAGLVATALSLVVVATWLRPPGDPSSPPGAFVGTLVFAVCGIAFSYVAELARRSRSEERRQRQLAERAQADAIAASRAKDDFIAVLGHELRNPLAPIASASTLLRMRNASSRELDVIDRQVKHMSRLIDDLLDVSRIVEGRLELQREVAELGAIVEKAAEMVVPHRDRTGRGVDIDIPRGLYVDVDPARMVQAITNLLNNAIKFSAADQPIRVVAARVDSQVELRISDYGVGMDAHMLEHAFDAFSQSPQAIDRAAGGIGLGLTIARHLAAVHGGSLAAFSEGPGKGTEMRLRLPLAEKPAAEATPEGEAAHSATQRILVVDDNEDNAQMLGDLLAIRGHQVRVAFDATAALELLRDFEPTVALLDIGLPDMDGHQLARAMRERGIGARLIAVTGYGQAADRKRALEAGFDEHLVKPVSTARIDELLRELPVAA